MSSTIFTQLQVVPSWFVTFPQFAGGSWKNEFFKYVCEGVHKHNVRKCIHSLKQNIYYRIHKNTYFQMITSFKKFVIITIFKE